MMPAIIPAAPSGLRPCSLALTALVLGTAGSGPLRAETGRSPAEFTVSSDLSALRTTSPALTSSAAVGPLAGPSPAAGSLPTENLIVNGSAENGAASSDGIVLVPIPGWTVATGGPTVILYTLSSSFGSAGVADPGPADRGTAPNLKYFTGGNANVTSALTQVIDLSSWATALDSGGISYQLSGYLGGWLSQNDNARLSVDFRTAGHVTLGTPGVLGPDLAVDRAYKTGLFPRTITGSVPAGAREALVTLTLTRTDGIYNDGYADNLTLTLVPEPGTWAVSGGFGLAAFAAWRRLRRV